MGPMHERYEPPTVTSDLVAMAVMLFTMPRPIHKVDAIVVLPGQGEDWRLHDAVAAWNTTPGARYFLVAGGHMEEKTWFLPTVEILRESYGLTRTDGKIIIQPSATDTPKQADWIVPTVQKLGITSLALVVSPYHLLRGYCTVLKAFWRLGVPQIPMIPVPAMVSPTTPNEEKGLPGWHLVSGEVNRIITYREKGDVAMPPELLSYLDWLWRQPIIASSITPCVRT